MFLPGKQSPKLSFPPITYIAAMLPLIIRVDASEYNKPVCRQQSAQPSLVGQRCVTDTEVYTNKTGVQDQHHCTLLCMCDPTCQIINFNMTGRYCQLGRGPCVTLEREVTFVTLPMSRQPCLKWVPNIYKDVYEIISFEKITGSSVFITVARARIGRNKIPGKKTSGHSDVYYTSEGRERWLPESECEYLTLSPECTISWVPHDSTSGNPLPVATVNGGNLNGFPLYVARKFAEHRPGHPAAYCSGYYDNVNGLGHFPYDGLDTVYSEMELIVIQG